MPPSLTFEAFEAPPLPPRLRSLPSPLHPHLRSLRSPPPFVLAFEASSSPSKPSKPPPPFVLAFEAFEAPFVLTPPSSSPLKSHPPPLRPRLRSPLRPHLRSLGSPFVLPFEAFEAFVLTLRSLRSLRPHLRSLRSLQTFSPPPRSLDPSASKALKASKPPSPKGNGMQPHLLPLGGAARLQVASQLSLRSRVYVSLSQSMGMETRYLPGPTVVVLKEE